MFKCYILYNKKIISIYSFSTFLCMYLHASASVLIHFDNNFDTSTELNLNIFFCWACTKSLVHRVQHNLLAFSTVCTACSLCSRFAGSLPCLFCPAQHLLPWGAAAEDYTIAYLSIAFILLHFAMHIASPSLVHIA